jgi:glycosyltransferase involved in cell wall biosynthesis
MNKLLTIVIPAYNSEAYLNRCLDSLIVPEIMDEVQVLIINDGSTDRTSEIAHEYQSRYPNTFVAIDKENGNYGSCMNIGLKMAEGKYFRTLDSDDWYDRDGYIFFIEELKKTEADMLVCTKKEVKGQSEIIEVFDDTLVCYQDLIVSDDILMNDTIHLFVGNISFKTNILRASNLKWSEHVFYTDTEYVFFPLGFVKTIRLIPKPVYVYKTDNEGQSMSYVNIQRNFNSFFTVAEKILNNYNTINSDHLPRTKRKAILILLEFCYWHLLIGRRDSFIYIRNFTSVPLKWDDLNISY